MSEQAIVERQASALTAAERGDPWLEMIERAARDPAVQVEKMERLFDLSEKARANQARAEFAAAFSALLPDLPVIDRKGCIVIYAKDDTTRSRAPIQSTPYATLDDILDKLLPVLSKHGFGLRFDHETHAAGDSYRISTKATLTHRGGHSESASTPPLLQDSSGSKNNVQAVGSTLAYGKRYALRAVLPIVSHAPQDADDDGRLGGAPPPLDEAKVKRLETLISETNTALEVVLMAYRVDSIEAMSAAQAAETEARLLQRKRALERKAGQ